MTTAGQTDAGLTKAQVRAVKNPLVPPLSLPHYVDPGSASSCPHSYHSLGHCLRTNMFPGAPLTWRSLAQDSYVSHPVTAWPTDPHLWFGHKTDEMVCPVDREKHHEPEAQQDTDGNGKKGHRKKRSCFLP